MRRAIDELRESFSTAEPVSFLSVLDFGRKLYMESREEGGEDEMMSQKYHFLRLLNEYQERCTAEGRYLLAEEFVQHEKGLVTDETDRQIGMAQHKYEKGKKKIVKAHSDQIHQFRESE